MIRTEILIRAGRQHLSRSILARAVGRVLDESTTFLSRTTAHRRSTCATRRTLSLPYPFSQRRNNGITLGRGAMHQVFPGILGVTSGALIRAHDTHPFFSLSLSLSQAPNHVCGEDGSVGAPPSHEKTSDFLIHATRGENKKRKERRRSRRHWRDFFLYRGDTVSPPRADVDAVRLDSQLNRSERSTWSAGCPSRRSTLTTPPPFS